MDKELIQRIYRYVNRIFFACDTFCFIIILYLIRRESKSMPKYKYYLSINFIMSYLLALLCFLFEPMPVMKNVLGVYFEGLLGSFGMYGLLLAIGCYIMLTVSLLTSILFRFINVSL